ncbi:MAG: hypothetical protein LBJ58_03655 [Tannerellaceae bacterium]|jgi:hypothetical protein|nr:hypothetical protein [Tannerellaceae bacterium]
MKKLLTALFVTSVLFSCEGPEGPPGEPGMETQWKYVYYTVNQQDWEPVGNYNELGSFYRYGFDEPNLTDFIYTEGVVMGYAVINPGTREEILRPLPDTWPMAEDTNTWTESVTFDYMPGYVTFYVGYSDFATGIRPPTMTFKLMMIW